MSSQSHTNNFTESDTLLQRRDDRHLTNPVGDESVLLNLDTGDYLGLNNVAAFIWRLLEHPIRLSELERELLSAFDIDINTCREETRVFLQRLESLGLLVYPFPQER
jgi:hypothetical protein